MQSGLPIGRMVPRQPHTPESHARRKCKRCGCAMSRYASHAQTQHGEYIEANCAPCERTIQAEAALRTPAFTKQRQPQVDCAAERARQAATAHGRCRTCDKPLSYPDRNTSGQCRGCVARANADAAWKPPHRCAAGCGRVVHRADRECRECYNRARRSAETCANGHPRTPENTYQRANGWNVCRACRRERERRAA